MQKSEPGIAQYGLRVAVDYRHLGVGTLPGSLCWEGEGAKLDGAMLRVAQRATGELTISGERQTRILLERGAFADIEIVTAGSAPHLCDLVVVLDDEADCVIRGHHRVEGVVRIHTEVILAKGASYRETVRAEVASSAVFDSYTYIRHAAPEARSQLAMRFVLEEGAKVVGRGKVVVEKGAVRSRATQRLDALLLGNRAEANLLPIMEVATDDVVCRHAATTVQPDVEALFYLQTRGLSASEAKQLLAEAFLQR